MLRIAIHDHRQPTDRIQSEKRWREVFAFDKIVAGDSVGQCHFLQHDGGFVAVRCRNGMQIDHKTHSFWRSKAGVSLCSRHSKTRRLTAHLFASRRVKCTIVPHSRSHPPNPLLLPLWMIHASPASSTTLIGLVGQLGLTRHVIAPDTLGNGDSAPPAETAPQMPYYAAAALRNYMDALGVGAIDLYGSHTGAHIAVEIAIAAPASRAPHDPGWHRHVLARGHRGVISQLRACHRTRLLWQSIQLGLALCARPGVVLPWFKRDRAHLRGLDAPSAEVLHMITVDVLKAIRTYHLGYRAAFAHDDYARLPLVRAHTRHGRRERSVERASKLPQGCCRLRSNAT